VKASRDHIFSNSIRALAGLIKCKYCNGVIEPFSVKAGVYYICYNSKKENCSNKFKISGEQVEAIILDDLKEKYVTPQRFKSETRLMQKKIRKAINLRSSPEPRIIDSYYVTYTSIQSIGLLNEENKSEVKTAHEMMKLRDILVKSG